MNNNSLRYKIGLSLIPGVGSILAKKLIAYTGDAESIFKDKKKTLLKIPGIGNNIVEKIKSGEILQRADEEIKFLSKYKIKSLFYLDKDYPERLKHCEDGPINIFVKGDVDFNQQKIISIVGTRNATLYGKEICNKLIKDIKEHKHNVLIVSGLAYGVDVCAHKAALENDLETVAVLGHGLDNIYPVYHKKIASEIIKKGALLTEFLSSSTFDRKNFVRRNRIIAGLSDATIIIESGIKGGALITADIANSYNRDVFAFPGKINDNYSVGCNRLIKSNRAALIENVNDLEYILGWDYSPKNKIVKQRELFYELTKEEKTIVEILKTQGKISIDIISLKADMPVSKVSSILLNLEFSGLVRSLPGKIYSLI